MTEWSPPSIPRPVLAALVLAYLALLGYGLIVVQQVLLFGVLPAIALVTAYVLWRFLVVFEAIADALQRIAAERERE
jgi:hypothetical protein